MFKYRNTKIKNNTKCIKLKWNEKYTDRWTGDKQFLPFM